MGRGSWPPKAIFYSLLVLAGFLLSINYFYPVAAFIGNNLATRKALYHRNDFDHKKPYYDKVFSEYKYAAFLLKFPRIIEAIGSLGKVNYDDIAYPREMELIRAFEELAEMPPGEKRRTVLYIPKTLRTYWDLQTHRGTNCLIAPAMTGIAMIEGFPDQIDDPESWPEPWSYIAYQKTAKGRAPVRDMSTEDMCSSARRAGFKRVIRMDQGRDGGIQARVHTCP